MSEDITTNVEVFPIVVGIIVSIILIVIDLFLFTGIISTFGVIIGSACAGFLCKNSTVYAIIYGAIIGIIASIFFALTVGFGNAFFLYTLLGIFGAFVGKVIQSKVV